MSENQREMVENKDIFHNSTYIKEEKTQGVRTESSGEYLLPDYMGDVKRLLRFSANACPVSKLAGQDAVSFLGTVNYRILYLDAEDKLTEASFSSDYEYERAVTDGFIDADIETEVQNLSVRLVGPRKISAKASLCHNVYSVSEQTVKCKGLTEGFEKRIAEVRQHSAVYFSSEARELAEELGRLDGISSDEVEVIKCECVMGAATVRASDGCAELKGEAKLYAILSIGGDTVTLSRTVPIEERITASRVIPEGAVCSGRVFVTDATVNLNNESSSADNGTLGCYASVVMSVTVECRGRADYNEVTKVVTDAYAVAHKCEQSYGKLQYTELLESRFDQRAYSSEIKKSELGAEGLHDLLECDARICNVRTEECAEGIELCAEVSFTVIARDERDGAVVSIKYPVEYKSIVKSKVNDDKARTRVALQIYSPSVTHDADKVYFAFDAVECVTVEITHEMSVLSSVTATPEERCSSRRVIAYYPEKLDTVYEIAKKYAVSTNDIIAGNADSLSVATDVYSPEALDGVSRILIRK